MLLTFHKISFDSREGVCTSNKGNGLSRPSFKQKVLIHFLFSPAEIYPKVYHTCFFIVTYFAPLCLMVLAYIQICHKLWFQQVCHLDDFLSFFFFLFNHYLGLKDGGYSFWLRPTPSPTDTWKHISDAEEVEVHAVLGSQSSPDRAHEG